VDTAFVDAYSGFNKLIVNNQIIPIHFEEFDDFNIAVFVQDSITNLLFSGAQGAIKNEFLFNRNKAFDEFSKKWKPSETEFSEWETSVDSLTSHWQDQIDAYPLSDIFKADEKMYYESYATYAKLYFKEVKSGNPDIREATLDEFTDKEYDSFRYYTTIPQYTELANTFHFQQILNKEFVSQARSYLAKLPGDIMSDYVRNKAFLESLEHHPRAKYLYRVARPALYSHNSKSRRLYRNSTKTAAGNAIKMPSATTLDGKNVNWEPVKGKKIYLMLYNFSDPYLRQNLLLWNQWFANNNNNDTVFISAAMDANTRLDVWKNLQFNSSIAGFNVKMTSKDAAKYSKYLGLILTPRVIEIAPDGLIVDPNLELGFRKY